MIPTGIRPENQSEPMHGENVRGEGEIIEISNRAVIPKEFQ
jgi:hypothetical protein